MENTIYIVVVVTNEFGLGYTPRDVSLHRTLEGAVAAFNRQRDDRLASHTHRRVHEVNEAGAIKMCVLCDIDGYTTSITMVKAQLQ